MYRLPRNHSEIVYLIILLIFVFNMKGCFSVRIKEDYISKQEAIDIANRKIKDLSIDVTKMAMEITMHDQPWNEYLPREDNSQYSLERKKILEGKSYWAVYYYHPIRGRTVTKGGDAAIFIDAKSGAVLTTYLGE